MTTTMEHSELTDVAELLLSVLHTMGVEHFTSSIVIMGNYYPSQFSGSCIVWSGGIAPTVRENHGQVTATNVICK